MKYFLTSLIILSCFTSCENKDDNPSTQAICDTSNSLFKQIYGAFSTSSTSHELVSVDLQIHEYSFFVSAPKTICSIGYKSTHSDATVPYTIEIINNATATIAYSGSHLFSTTATSYVTPNSTIALQPNISYTIRRTQTNWGTDLANLIGRLSISFDSAADTVDLLPMTVNDMTITSSAFDSNLVTRTQGFASLPFIDIVFEN